MRLVGLISAAAAALLVAGCAPDSGTVTGRKINAQAKYVVCVRDDAGHEGCDLVNVQVYGACSVGKPWPKCRDEVGRRP